MIDIYKRRKELNLTLEEIASIVGVSKSTVKKWEDGYIKNMRRDKIVKLASALKVSPLEFLDITQPFQEANFQSSYLTKSLCQKLEPLLSEAFGEAPKDSFALIIDDNKIFFLNSKTPHLKNILDIIK